MEFNEFCELIAEHIKDYLPPKYADAKAGIELVEKNNGVQLAGIRIRVPDENAAPIIYLDEFYKELLRGNDIRNILKEIAELRVQHDIPKQLDVEDLINYEKVKDNIVFEVVGAEANKERLDHIPHKIEQDMAITYKVMVGTIGDYGMGIIHINNAVMEQLGVNADTLHELALKNTQQLFPPVFQTMEETLKELFQKGAGDSNEKEFQEIMEFLNSSEVKSMIPMYVLTNERNINGAATLFYPGIREWIAEQMKSDYFILPSSVHEVIIVPDDGRMNFRELKEMVQEINGTQISPEEVLTNEVYFFDQENKYLCKASEKDGIKNKLVEAVKENMKKDVKKQEEKNKQKEKNMKNMRQNQRMDLER